MIFIYINKLQKEERRMMISIPLAFLGLTVLTVFFIFIFKNPSRYLGYVAAGFMACFEIASVIMSPILGCIFLVLCGLMALLIFKELIKDEPAKQWQLFCFHLLTLLIISGLILQVFEAITCQRIL